MAARQALNHVRPGVRDHVGGDAEHEDAEDVERDIGVGASSMNGYSSTPTIGRQTRIADGWRLQQLHRGLVSSIQALSSV